MRHFLSRLLVWGVWKKENPVLRDSCGQCVAHTHVHVGSTNWTQLLFYKDMKLGEGVLLGLRGGGEV